MPHLRGTPQRGTGEFGHSPDCRCTRHSLQELLRRQDDKSRRLWRSQSEGLPYALVEARTASDPAMVEIYEGPAEEAYEVALERRRRGEFVFVHPSSRARGHLRRAPLGGVQ